MCDLKTRSRDAAWRARDVSTRARDVLTRARDVLTRALDVLTLSRDVALRAADVTPRSIRSVDSRCLYSSYKSFSNLLYFYTLCTDHYTEYLLLFPVYF